MEKLSGGFVLDCGHTQVVSESRATLARTGKQQHSVWCIDCDAWSKLQPVSSDTSQEETLDGNTLQ